MNYDFVEIGTCDFTTELQTNPGRGISVEPLQDYLDKLPNRPDVIKECAAISDVDGNIEIFYIPKSIIKQMKMPYWIKGCNRIGEPHPTIVKWLTNHGHPLSLIQKKSVPVMTFSNLCDKHRIKSIKYLKVDTEGHDYTILCSLRDAVVSGKVAWPDMIKTECNALTPIQTRKEMIALLQGSGYTVAQSQTDLIATRA